jgi:hypothetical protein
MEFLEVHGGAGLVGELLASQPCASREKLAYQRSVEHLAKRARERGLGPSRIVDFERQPLERVEGQRIDVGDERVAEPREGLFEVVEVAMRHRRRAAHERPTRLAPVAGSLTTRRHGG